MGANLLDVSVLIPAWNEKENLISLLPALADRLRRLGVAYELIVIDAGSRDGTQEAAQAAGARVIPQQERGYGGALMAGFAEARAPYVVTMDADLSHPAEFLNTFWEHRHDAEMLIASRYVAGGSADMTLFRRALSVILNNWNGGGLKPPDFLTAAFIKGRSPGNWAFTGSPSAAGIKHGRNKEPRRWSRRRGQAANPVCSRFNWMSWARD